MKKILTLAAVFGALTSAVLAAPATMDKAPSKPAKSAMPKCPKCKMPLVAKADKTHTEAVKIKGKTYYCCAACGAHKGAKTAKDGKKVASLKCPNCGMNMTTTKGGPMYSTPMKVKGVTYYCCPGCQKH